MHSLSIINTGSSWCETGEYRQIIEFVKLNKLDINDPVSNTFRAFIFYFMVSGSRKQIRQSSANLMDMVQNSFLIHFSQFILCVAMEDLCKKLLYK